MINYIANGIGISAVIVYLLSYQQKSRKGIMAFGMVCRALYLVQYVMLLAYEGAILEILSMITLFFAQKKSHPLVQKWKPFVIIGSAIILTAGGLAFYKDLFSLLVVVGCVLQMIAFWMSTEFKIRWVSLIAAPCWLIYNIHNGAYGVAVGDVLSMVSIIVAMFRYDLKKEKSAEE